MNPLNLLSVDDKDYLIQAVVTQYFDSQWEVTSVFSYQESLTLLRSRHFDVLLLDTDLGHNSPTGIELIPRYLEEFPNLVIIVVTNGDDIADMRTALKLGASDYIVKSDTICEDLDLKIPECIERVRHQRLAEIYQKEMKYEEPLCLLGSSYQIQALRESVRKQISQETPLVLIGEPGSGKFSLARYFWHMKNDPYRPFICFKASKIPKMNLEVSLFGEQTPPKTSMKKGVFSEAQFGDLLIPDFNVLNGSFQKKIIQSALSKSIKPKGSPVHFAIQNRLILNCQKNSSYTKKYKKFFKHIYLPPLRDRKEDIPKILKTYLDRYKSKQYFLSSRALEFLQSQKWPKNIEQLTHVIDAIISNLESNRREKIDVSDFIRIQEEYALNLGTLELTLPKDKDVIQPNSYTDFLASCQRSFFTHVLDIFEGNILKTAQALGISKSTFYRKLKKLKILEK